MRNVLFICVSLLVSCKYAYCTTAIDDICGVQTTTPPTPPNSLVWQAARFAANQVYYGNDFQIKALGSPAGTPLHNGDDALNRNNVALGVHYNSFVSGEIKGCIYSSNDIDLRNKIFIAFRGTQSMSDWYKNFFGISSFDPTSHVQKSYADDVRALINNVRTNDDFSSALIRHIDFILGGQAKRDKNILPELWRDLEYYFVGHSRGGGLALLVAERFKRGEIFRNNTEEEIERTKVKVITFCAPKLANANKKQLEFVENIGFKNIIHFVRSSDLAHQFPFRFVENYGVKIPLTPCYFWSVRNSHAIPNAREIDASVTAFNQCRSVGWADPFYNLFSLEFKPLLWGLCGSYLAHSILKSRNVKICILRVAYYLGKGVFDLLEFLERIHRSIRMGVLHK